MILRNTQCIKPVTHLHKYLETQTELIQTELKCDFIGMLESESEFLTKISIGGEITSFLHTWGFTYSGGSGLFQMANSMNHSCEPNVIVMSCYPDYRIRGKEKKKKKLYPMKLIESEF